MRSLRPLNRGKGVDRSRFSRGVSCLLRHLERPRRAFLGRHEISVGHEGAGDQAMQVRDVRRGAGERLIERRPIELAGFVAFPLALQKLAACQDRIHLGFYRRTRRRDHAKQRQGWPNFHRKMSLAAVEVRNIA